MAERMPTDQDIAAYIQMLYGSPTAKTPAARLNFAQDLWKSAGIDPNAMQFVPEPFPEEQFAPVTRQIYATDATSPYLSIFDAIDQGIDPTSAARDAIEAGNFGDPFAVRDDRLDEDILRTAREYAGELKTFEQERAKWNREQARMQAEAPVTLNEILFPQSEYEVRSQALGMPEGYSVDDMLAAYNRSRFEAGQAGRRRGMEQRAARQPAAAQPAEAKSGGGVWRTISDVAGNIVAPWRQQEIEKQRQRAPKAGSTGGKKVAPAAVPQQRKAADYRVGPEGSIADLIYRDAARRAMEQQKQTPRWTPKAEQAMRNLSLLSLLGGQ